MVLDDSHCDGVHPDGKRQAFELLAREKALRAGGLARSFYGPGVVEMGLCLGRETHTYTHTFTHSHTCLYTHSLNSHAYIKQRERGREVERGAKGGKTNVHIYMIIIYASNSDFFTYL